jgi:hypothetical protein
MSQTYLPEVLPVPTPMDGGLDKPYLDGLTEERLVIQRCGACQTWIWGPEHVCYRCLAWDPEWVEVEPRGRIHAWTRIWSPGFAPLRPVKIGDEVAGVFEHHRVADYKYSLLQWKTSGG